MMFENNVIDVYFLNLSIPHPHIRGFPRHRCDELEFNGVIARGGPVFQALKWLISGSTEILVMCIYMYHRLGESHMPHATGSQVNRLARRQVSRVSMCQLLSTINL